MSGTRAQIVGFTLHRDLSGAAALAADAALDQALAHLPPLQRTTMRLGQSLLTLWGRGDLPSQVHTLPDGASALLVGSPVGPRDAATITTTLQRFADRRNSDPAWDGRYILLRISPDGRQWTMYNDWCGSIPLYHASTNSGCIASTLEPAVVEACDLISDHFFLPALVSLLLNGHYLADWTLFEPMRVVRADHVAQWTDRNFQSRPLHTVQPSDALFTAGWDDLVDQMHALSHRAIADCLREAPTWILPLSGGLDSRLIASVGAQLGVDMRAFTYGPAGWNESIYAKAVAKSLHLPWKRIGFGADYLRDHTATWAHWFGSAMHFHGMYQLPFLEALRNEIDAPILQGYMGDPLAGNHIPTLMRTHADHNRCNPVTDAGVHWPIDELRTLLRKPCDDAIEQVRLQTQAEIDSVPGSRFQKLSMLDLRNRQRLFVSYQPMMYDYWRGVGTPLMSRDLARFCLSLPRTALDHRRLQVDMFRRYHPTVAAIPSTHGNQPIEMRTSWSLKRWLAWHLPPALRRGPLREFNPLGNTAAQDCLHAHGCQSLWPLNQTCENLDQWFDTATLQRMIEAALTGNSGTSKCVPIQTVAYRLQRRATSANLQRAA